MIRKNVLLQLTQLRTITAAKKIYERQRRRRRVPTNECTSFCQLRCKLVWTAKHSRSCCLLACLAHFNCKSETQKINLEMSDLIKLVFAALDGADSTNCF